MGRGGCSSIAAVTCHAGTGDRGDDARSGAHLAHNIVPGVGDVQVVCRVEGQAFGQGQGRVSGGSTISAISLVRGYAGYRGDDLGHRVDAADGVIAGIGEVQVAGAIQHDACGRVDLGRGRQSSIARVARASCATHGGDEPGGRIHTADTVVTRVGKIDVAGGVRHDAHRQEDGRLRRQRAVTVVDPGRVTGNRVDGARH